jgi:mycofactocin precursor
MPDTAVQSRPAVETGTPAGSADPVDATTDQRPADDLVEADLLVEDVSIDGLCGVY